MLPAKKPRGATAIRSERQGIQRNHLAVAATIMLLIVAVTVLAPSKEVEATRNAPADPGLAVEPAPDLQLVLEATQDAGEAPDLDHTPAPAPAWIEQTVRSGDNLSLIFKRAGFSDRDMYRVVNTAADGKGLGKLYPGQTIAFKTTDDGELSGVRHIISPLESVTYERADDTFTSERSLRTPEVREAWASGEITSSLYMAGQDAGLSQAMIMELASIFGGVIDFVLDPRKGDTFHLIYDELYLDGGKYKDGTIIAASFTNQGETFSAYRYEDQHGDVSFYNEDGVSMRKAFLMAPVDFTRISSNFNLRRLHPIYKTTRPHRGTDYAAPTGTPVYASGDGRVIEAGYSRANGNYVFIQHGEQYITKYLHLNKRKVRKGQRVSQSQVIGTVGSTGAATGPHLHYEFLVNGVHRNPRTIHKQLPKAKALPADELPRFRLAINAPAEQLATLQSNNTLALNDAAVVDQSN